jgi:hypothetical protein
MSSTIHHQPDGIRAELLAMEAHCDASDHLLEDRVTALEEAAVSWRAWLRLRRSLRRSARAYRWTKSFAAARAEQGLSDYAGLRDRQAAR